MWQLLPSPVWGFLCSFLLKRASLLSIILRCFSLCSTILHLLCILGQLNNGASHQAGRRQNWLGFGCAWRFWPCLLVGEMRFLAMPPWLRVAVVLAMVMCALVAVVALAAEEESKKEFIAVHRTLPARLHYQNHHHEEEGEEPKLQWRFNPFNPFQTFVVSKDGHRHKKCGLAAKLASWFPNVFGHPRYFGHRHHHDVEEEMEKEKEEEKVVGRPFLTFGRHHSWLPFRTENHEHHHQHGEYHLLGEDKEHQLKRHRKGSWNRIKGFFSDMSDQIESCHMPAHPRKAPTLQSASEPLDVHTLRRHVTRKSSCDLRERLSSVFASVLKEVAVSADSTIDKDTYKDTVKSNLKRLMGDYMELAILKNACDTSAMSPCHQDFCDVFLSHPQSGILMAFGILGINPIKAAISPESVSRNLPPFINRHEDLVMSQADLNLMAKFRQVRRLAHIVHANMERLSAENPENMLSDLQHKLKKHLPEAFGGEVNPCKACLRQEIFQMKRLAKRALSAACESPVDSIVEQSCKFVKENKFVAKTMFAYKFRFWEKAALACNSKKDCHTLLPPALDQSGHGLKFSLESQEQQTHLPFLDVDSIRHTRQRALHRAALLRGHSLNLLASELMKVGDGLSQNGEIGPVLVLEISSQPQLLFPGMEGSGLPTLTSVHLDGVSKIEPIHSEFIFGGEMQPFHDFLRKPVFDLNPVHVELTGTSPVVGSQVKAVGSLKFLEAPAPHTIDASTVVISPIVEESVVKTHHDSFEEGSTIAQHMDM